MPPEAPRPDQIIGDYPFLLEYSVLASPDMMVTVLRQQRVVRELELILSSLLDFRVWSLGPNYRKHWCFDVSDGQVRFPSKFLQEGYGWDGPQPSGDDFTDTNGFISVALIEINQYYSMRGISIDRSLDLPADLPQQLDRFFALTTTDREKFLRASYWFQHAGTVFSYSKSASFIALVSAVEALMPEPSAGEPCPQCKQRIGAGPTRRFVEFVESTVPNSGISNQERRRFYRVRSALAHGGKLLAVDHNNWGFTPKQLGEDYDARTMWRIVQIVLHNWLAQSIAADH